MIPGLQVDTEYKFRVSAKSSVGLGEPSDTVTVVSTYGKMFDSSYLTSLTRDITGIFFRGAKVFFSCFFLA